MRIKSKADSGFTLIELIVVLGMLGILYMLIISFIDPVTQLRKARDGARKSDLRQIQSALEMHRADIGAYPEQPAVDVYRLNSTDCPTSNALTSGSITFINKIPCDPKGTSISYNNGNYYYSKSGSTYTLGACLENSKDTGANVQASSPGGTGSCSSSKYFLLQNP